MTDHSFEFTRAITRRPARSVIDGLRAEDHGTPDFDQMLKDHAPIVSLLQEGKVKVAGNITLDKEYASKFTKDAAGNTVLQISSGTIELKNNKVIVLAD